MGVYELSGIQLIEPETSMTISETHSDYTAMEFHVMEHRWFIDNC